MSLFPHSHCPEKAFPIESSNPQSLPKAPFPRETQIIKIPFTLQSYQEG